MTTTRTLGRSGIEVSAIGMGCWAIGGPLWGDDGAAVRLGRGRRRRVDPHRPPRAGPRRDLLRHRQQLRRRAQRTGPRPGPGRAAGRAWSSPPSSATSSTRRPGGRSAPTPARRIAVRCLDGIAAPARHRLPRPLPAAHQRPADAAGARSGRDRWRPWSTRARSGRTAGAPTTRTSAAAFAAAGAALRRDPARRVGAARQRGDAGGAATSTTWPAINRGPLAMGLLTGKYTAPRRRSGPTTCADGAPDWLAWFTDGAADTAMGGAGRRRSARRSPPTAAPSRRARWAGCSRAARAPCRSPACARWPRPTRTSAPWHAGPLTRGRVRRGRAAAGRPTPAVGRLA